MQHPAFHCGCEMSSDGLTRITERIIKLLMKSQKIVGITDQGVQVFQTSAKVNKSKTPGETHLFDRCVNSALVKSCVL